MFELQSLPISGAFVLTSRVLRDDRGDFHKTVYAPFFEQHGLCWSFAEQFYSVSKKDVIRGLHFQKPPYDHVKLIHCSAGRAVDVLLDLRPQSSTYGQCTDVKIEAHDGRSIYIPKGIAHGFHALADNTTIHYSVSTSYEPSADQGILWNSIPYDWGVMNPILSNRDETFPKLKDFKSPF